MNKENTDAAADILNNPLTGYKNVTRKEVGRCCHIKGGLVASLPFARHVFDICQFISHIIAISKTLWLK